jgi:hypothetical protein
MTIGYYIDKREIKVVGKELPNQKNGREKQVIKRFFFLFLSVENSQKKDTFSTLNTPKICLADG